MPRPIHVGRVGAQDEHAAVAQLGERAVVGRLAVERRRIQLEVAGVHDRARRRLDGQADAVDDGVSDADGLDSERTTLDPIAWTHGAQIGLEEAVFLQPVAHQGQGHRRPVHRHASVAQEIREGADVVLVAMREEDRAKVAALGQRVREVGDHVVDAGQLVIGKHQPAVDGDEIVAGLDEHHVQTDLAEAAEGDEPNCGVHATPFGLRSPS